MKIKTLVFSLLAIFAITMTSCEAKQNSDSQMAEEMENLIKAGNDAVGVPAISKFFEKSMVKYIYELCDDPNLICHAYFYNQMTGDIGRYIGPVIGYGIPYSAQFSSPLKYSGVSTPKIVNDGGRDWTYGYEMVPQAEPNGIFKPEGLSATWLIMVKDGKPYPAYIEPEICVFPFKMHKEKK